MKYIFTVLFLFSLIVIPACNNSVSEENNTEKAVSHPAINKITSMNTNSAANKNKITFADIECLPISSNILNQITAKSTIVDAKIDEQGVSAVKRISDYSSGYFVAALYSEPESLKGKSAVWYFAQSLREPSAVYPADDFTEAVNSFKVNNNMFPTLFSLLDNDVTSFIEYDFVKQCTRVNKTILVAESAETKPTPEPAETKPAPEPAETKPAPEPPKATSEPEAVDDDDDDPLGLKNMAERYNFEVNYYKNLEEENSVRTEEYEYALSTHPQSPDKWKEIVVAVSLVDTKTGEYVDDPLGVGVIFFELEEAYFEGIGYQLPMIVDGTSFKWGGPDVFSCDVATKIDTHERSELFTSDEWYKTKHSCTDMNTSGIAFGKPAWTAKLVLHPNLKIRSPFTSVKINMAVGITFMEGSPFAGKGLAAKNVYEETEDGTIVSSRLVIFPYKFDENGPVSVY